MGHLRENGVVLKYFVLSVVTHFDQWNINIHHFRIQRLYRIISFIPLNKLALKTLSKVSILPLILEIDIVMDCTQCIIYNSPPFSHYPCARVLGACCHQQHYFVNRVFLFAAPCPG